MASKTVQLSVRISDTDAAFLASLNIDGANTPSEKLRAILKSERERQTIGGDASEIADMVRGMMRAARRRIRGAERAHKVRSDVVTDLYERVPELAGFLMAGPTEESRPALAEFEAALVADLYALIEETLSIALVARNRVYDEAVAEPHLSPVLDLVALIKAAQPTTKGTK
ncbi:hypothetical protein [Pyruvatibacter sp.]|uniref:hypothetical protein n=1 Tax=Pyruvatibacter sp. TaxID=1981328 RepID=UPI0032662212